MARQEIVSPIPGTFYRRSDPKAEPFVTEGQVVNAADPICLIEVMKNFHSVPAGVDGTFVEFLVDDEDVVGPGQPVAVVEDGA